MPQLENGYTRIADEILENVAKTKLNGTQLRILLIVWRSTYGWQKKEHELSEKYLSEATGIHKQQIKRELRALIELEIITVVKEPTFSSGRVLKFNKNFSTQVAKKIPPSEKATTTGSELDTSTGSELDTQNKDINKQYKYKGVYDYYLTLDLIKHKKYTDDMREAMKHAENKLGIDCEHMKRMLKRHEQKVKQSKGDYKVKKRSLAEFFGQKKYQSKLLICSDYHDDLFTNEKPTENNEDWRKVEWSKT